MRGPTNSCVCSISGRSASSGARGSHAAGATVILTTHILEVAERLADRIGIIGHGRLVADGTLAELARKAGGAAGLEETFLALTQRQSTSLDRAA